MSCWTSRNDIKRVRGQIAVASAESCMLDPKVVWGLATTAADQARAPDSLAEGLAPHQSAGGRLRCVRHNLFRQVRVIATKSATHIPWTIQIP